ncbi:MAG: hypothetical protein ACXVQ3_03720 [Gaiellaceae bacterium]
MAVKKRRLNRLMNLRVLAGVVILVDVAAAALWEWTNVNGIDALAPNVISEGAAFAVG